MLQLRPSCECCDKPLPPDSTEARICSFECTFCATCAAVTLNGTCPNCGYERARGDQCEQCTKQLDPTELIAPRSAISGSTDLEIRESRHLFLLQSKLADRLRAWIDTKVGVWPTVATSIDLVVHAELDRTGHRHVVEIVAPTGSSRDGVIESTRLFARSATGLVATDELPVQRDKLTRAGVDPALYLGAAR